MRYERRARSIRYGPVRAGSWRHLAQAQWRAVTDLRQPVRLVVLVASIASSTATAAGLGLRDAWLALVVGIGLPLALLTMGLCTWFQERRHARSQPGSPAMVSRPERPARRAPQDS